MNNENCVLKLVDEIILYYDRRSKQHQITYLYLHLLFLFIIKRKAFISRILEELQIVCVSLESAAVVLYLILIFQNP